MGATKSIISTDNEFITICPDTDLFVRVLVTDAEGCQGIDSVKLILGNKGNFLHADPIVTICRQNCVKLPAWIDANRSISHVFWTPSIGLDNPEILNPMACPPYELNYKVKAYEGQTCWDTGFDIGSLSQSL